MQLRRMTKEDLPQVEMIQRRIVRHEITPAFSKMLAKHTEDEDMIGLVAEENGKVIGFVLGETKIGGFGTDITGWLELISVEPERMGQGVGRSLSLEIFKEFAKAGVSEVLTAVRWDSGDMLAFFKSLGFDRSPFINLHVGVSA
ncbi:MAG: GNAT family N-acetyltransferase [Deltaproteobacteria bacterium]|nr:GNAT family N-acetyltransferase [Deltaproteobacteria bacterium]